MKATLINIIQKAIQMQVSDIHFVLTEELKIYFRDMSGIKLMPLTANKTLFEYLKFNANLDINGHFQSQSGAFQLTINEKQYFFRFSYIQHLSQCCGVLRILNNHPKLQMHDLTVERDVLRIFKKWITKRVGFCLFSGPTGSGKTTTVHVLLEEIAKRNQLKIVSLEDPIEIYSTSYLQLQVNEKSNFTYEEGIKHLMRQDPDVIMIGEIRDAYSAKMAFRAALSGHMVFSTIHAKSSEEALKRFIEFGINRDDIMNTLTGITNQRLFKRKSKNAKICVYEVMEEDDIQKSLMHQPTTHTTMKEKIVKYYEKGFIKKEDVKKEIEI